MGHLIFKNCSIQTLCEISSCFSSQELYTAGREGLMDNSLSRFRPLSLLPSLSLALSLARSLSLFLSLSLSRQVQRKGGARKGRRERGRERGREGCREEGTEGGGRDGRREGWRDGAGQVAAAEQSALHLSICVCLSLPFSLSLSLSWERDTGPSRVERAGERARVRVRKVERSCHTRAVTTFQGSGGLGKICHYWSERRYEYV